MIEVLSNGLPNVVQDLGRMGWLSLGVSRSGAMDSLALKAANALLDNDPNAAGIEVGLFPFRIRFRQDTRFACTGGDARALLDDSPLPPWWSASATEGQVLEVLAPRHGARAYLAFAGGIDVPQVLGSRSTDMKGSFGGLEGRGLRRGDLLALRPAATGPRPDTPTGLLPAELPGLLRELVAGCVTIRVTAGAEYHHFAEAARSALVEGDFEITAASNRMGYRLRGPLLQLLEPLELLSHGILPGTVQVPPSGQPIVQLAEANTCGGYPKIAHVIEADLWRLAQAKPGTRIRFELMEIDDVIDQARRETAHFATRAAPVPQEAST